MGIASDCYTPHTFKPGNSPLLSISQWQMLQLYLVDAMNLPLTSAQMPHPDVLAIYTRMHNQAVAFHGNTLPQAHTMGVNLYNYGLTASRSFAGVVKLTDEPNPNKDAILELLGNLQSAATGYHADADTINTSVSAYVSATQTDATDLQAAVTRETSKEGVDQTKIGQLHQDYQLKFTDMQQAQSTIVNDKNAIDDTKYYSWIPLIGTAVALAEIIEKNNDIKIQLARIQSDVIAMQRIQNQIQELEIEIAELVYTVQFSGHMVTEISNMMHGLEQIKSAWKTIVDELNDVITNAKLATASELKNQPCLAAVRLTAAANEWQDVAKDAHSFSLNFYVQPKNT